MELAMTALGSLLPKLGKLLTGQYKLQKGVRGEIKFLHAEMESMQAALNRVSKRPAHEIDDLLSIWVRDLKELSYDIEDRVDSFMLRVDAPGRAKQHSFRRFFDRAIGLLTKAKGRHHVADDIQDIKRRIQELAGRRERYNFPEVAVQTENTETGPRLPALYEDVKILIGIEGPAEKLADREGAQKQQLMVVGVGGLGETTLANTVYQRLQGEFQSQASVRWFSSVIELTSLSIRVNLLRQEDFNLLGSLPALRGLRLQVDLDGTTEEERLVVGAGHPFRSLTEFEFRHYARCWLEFAQGVMPRLQRLDLKFEARRRIGVGFDNGLENLASLKHVTVEVDCEGGYLGTVMHIENEARDAVDKHPNNPKLDMFRTLERWLI